VNRIGCDAAIDIIYNVRKKIVFYTMHWPKNVRKYVTTLHSIVDTDVSSRNNIFGKGITTYSAFWRATREQHNRIRIVSYSTLVTTATENLATTAAENLATTVANKHYRQQHHIA
jgi:hypothetical protein